VQIDLLISATSTNKYLIPVNFVFWGFVFVYVLHILEESILPETFVEKVKRLYFPEYSRKMFFSFNTVLLIFNISAVIIFEETGGTWIVFPLSLAVERIFNGFYHLTETIISKKYSSGLLTSVISWILGYLFVKYSLLKGEIPLNLFILSVIIGFSIFALMIFPLITGNLRRAYLIVKGRRQNVPPK
jgi:hypothetical protein